jgi:hypothetical protein
VCWQNHAAHYLNKNNNCKICHAIVSRASRLKINSPQKFRYVLNVEVFKRASHKRPVQVVAELAGLSHNTVLEWVYIKSRTHKQRATSLNNAQALANILHVDFNTLWRLL